jgi:4-hydroxymandelate oxidase
MLPTLADLRDAAKQRLSTQTWAYLQATATGVADDDAEQGWTRFRLRPRVLRDVGAVNAAATVLGATLDAPILIAPTGYQTAFDPAGEVATGEAAKRSGSLLIVSTRSTRRFADIAAATDDWWLQVYMMRDRGLTGAMIDAAVAAGARALVLTGDTPYLGAQPPLGADLDKTRAHLTNLNVDAAALAAGATVQDPTITFADIGWLAERSRLPVLVKGVLSADDARACAAAGAAGVVVSNHGGRQLDQVVDTAAALPAVADAVGDELTVLVDGGVRSGADILKALALGARAVLIGRPVLWGLAAAGAAGAAAVLDALHEDLTRVLKLAGVAHLDQVGRDLVTAT